MGVIAMFRIFEENDHTDFMFAGAGLLVTLCYLGVVSFFTNTETGQILPFVQENLKFWGPILEFIIGALILIGLLIAFGKSLKQKDAFPLVVLIYIVSVCSVIVCMIAPVLIMVLVTDASMSMGAVAAEAGMGFLTVALETIGPVSYAALFQCIVSFGVCLITAFTSLFGIYMIFNR